MPISVEYEDSSALKSWGIGLEKEMENCRFCHSPTRYWYKNRIPVCQGCALAHNDAELNLA